MVAGRVKGSMLFWERSSWCSAREQRSLTRLGAKN
jgi:hypothetical protein